VDLHNLQGHVQKSSTVYTNDPQRPQFNLLMKAMVNPWIQVAPSNSVLFRGFPEQLGRRSIDLISSGLPFRLLRSSTNLQQQIVIEQETVEVGRHYRLHVTNTATSGNYNGHIVCRTDHPKRPEIKIGVTGAIETELSISPLALLIGRSGADEPLRTGEIRVRHNRRHAFRISRLAYDDRLITVTLEALSSEATYILKVEPRLENVPEGEHRETTIIIETDSKGGDKNQVWVNVVNN
jgi:hypothetical protein